jgi:hypothetical protein
MNREIRKLLGDNQHTGFTESLLCPRRHHRHTGTSGWGTRAAITVAHGVHNKRSHLLIGTWIEDDEPAASTA